MAFIIASNSWITQSLYSFKQCLLQSLHFYLFVKYGTCTLVTFCFFDYINPWDYFLHHFLITITIYELFFEPFDSFFVTTFLGFKCWSTHPFLYITSVPLSILWYYSSSIVSLLKINQIYSLKHLNDWKFLVPLGAPDSDSLCCGLKFHSALQTALHLFCIF